MCSGFHGDHLAPTAAVRQHMRTLYACAFVHPLVGYELFLSTVLKLLSHVMLGSPCLPPLDSHVALESLRMSIIKVQILVCIHICNNESIVYTNLGERMLAKNSLLVDPSGIFETKQSPFTISTTCEKQMKILALNH